MKFWATIRNLFPERTDQVQFECLACGRGTKVDVPVSDLEAVEEGFVFVNCACGDVQRAQVANDAIREEARVKEAEKTEAREKAQEQYASDRPMVWGVAAAHGDGITYTQGRRVENITPLLAVFDLSMGKGIRVECCTFDGSRWNILGSKSRAYWELEPSQMRRILRLTTEPCGYVEVRRIKLDYVVKAEASPIARFEAAGAEEVAIFQEWPGDGRVLSVFRHDQWREITTEDPAIRALSEEDQQWIEERGDWLGQW